MDGIKSRRAVWQISGGLPGRDYADFLLKHGLALLGPGDEGPWREGRVDDLYGGPSVRRFATELRVGDALLLRVGHSTVRAVGVVASDYFYLADCDDVQGWDLQHARRVRWYRLPEPYDFGASVFGGLPALLAQVGQVEVRDFVERFLASPPTHWQDAPLPPLPPGEPPMADVPEQLAGLVGQAQDLLQLYDDPDRFGDAPAEDELIVHYVVPFLRALGWPVECIAVKWKYIDVVVFDSLPRSAASCRFVVEAKRLGQSSEGALAQARGYLRSLDIQRQAVVTDGVRYRLFAADGDAIPIAYANLARPKQSSSKLFDCLQRCPRS